MEEQTLQQKEEAITSEYRTFLDEVREAFNKHCDRIKDEATRKLEAIPEDDQEARQEVLDEQKAELDKTLAELKQLLARKGAEVRRHLEELANERDVEEFDLDVQLADIDSKEN